MAYQYRRWRLARTLLLMYSAGAIMRNIVFLLFVLSASVAVAAEQEFVVDDTCWLNLIDPAGFQLGLVAPLVCLGGHSVARDPWSVLDQIPGIDVERYDVAGQRSFQQSLILTCGSSPQENSWFYDGVDETDPVVAGGTGTYFNYNSLDSIEVVAGSGNPMTQAGGAIVRIVSQAPPARWSLNASVLGTNENLQSDNTPGEIPSTGTAARLDRYLEFGIDTGGSLYRDQLLVWAAFQRNQYDNHLLSHILQKSDITNFSLKTEWRPTALQTVDFEYFRNDKSVEGRQDLPAQIADLTLRNQKGSDTVLPGLWKGEYKWINKDWLVDAFYAYTGNGFSLIPIGGNDVPMIYLAAIPRYENTYYYQDPMDRPSHQVTANTTYYRSTKQMDHELRFGFEYRTSSIESFSSYGNGTFIVDYGQTLPQGPLTYGYLFAQRPIYYKAKITRSSLYASDTIHWKRLVMDLGLRIDNQHGENAPTIVPSPQGFESYVPPLEFHGTVPEISFRNVAPRFNVSFDVTGSGNTLLKAGYSRYNDPLLLPAVTHVNPGAIPSGAKFGYTNIDGDRTISQDELSSPSFYGPNCMGFVDAPCNSYDPELKNTRTDETVFGFDQLLPWDSAVTVHYLHRIFRDLYSSVPEGLGPEDFVQTGNLTLNTVLGYFSVPLYETTLSGPDVLRNIHGYDQAYNGFDILVRKRSGHAEFSGGAVFQSQKSQHHTPDAGAFTVDAGDLRGSLIPFDPTNQPFLSNAPYSYASDFGVYPYSRWQFKFVSTFFFPREIEVGTFVRYQEGYPYVLFASVADCGFECSHGTDHLVLLEPFGSRRYDNLFSMDVEVRKTFHLQNSKITAVVDIANVTNTNTVTQRQRLATSATFNSIIDYVPPRIFRFGLLFNF